MMKISFVIPCYGSEHTLAGVVSEIKAVVSRRPEVDYEIIMVSDHSPDNVYSVIERICKEDPIHSKGIELAKNFGQHAALMAGYARTTGDFVVSLDDDGQAPVDCLFKMVDTLREGAYDVVFGAYSDKKHGWFRNFGSKINGCMLQCLLGKPRGLHVTSFFALRKYVVDEIVGYSGAYPYIAGLLFRTTKNIVNVAVPHRERASGTSGYTLRKLLSLWMNGFTAFSVKPLQLATYTGCIVSLLGFGLGAWTIVKKIFVSPGMPVGYSSLMSALLFIGGAIMMMLGLIGEYIGRIYICINKSPQYVVRRKTEGTIE